VAVAAAPVVLRRAAAVAAVRRVPVVRRVPAARRLAAVRVAPRSNGLG
jgi:hypothetical protein